MSEAAEDERLPTRAETWGRIWKLVDSEANQWPANTDWDAIEAARKLARVDPGAGVAAMRALADDGSIVAMVDMAYFEADGIGMEPNVENAIERLRRPADTGDGLALYCLGRLYLIHHRDAEALQAFEQSAAKGFIPSQNLAGWMYAQGRGRARDVVNAAQYFRAAQRRGSLAAKILLGGLLLRNGPGLLARLRGLILLVRSVPMPPSDRHDAAPLLDMPTIRNALLDLVGLALLGWVLWLLVRSSGELHSTDFWPILALTCVSLIAAPFIIARRRARALKERLSAWPFRPQPAPPEKG